MNIFFGNNIHRFDQDVPSDVRPGSLIKLLPAPRFSVVGEDVYYRVIAVTPNRDKMYGEEVNAQDLEFVAARKNRPTYEVLA